MAEINLREMHIIVHIVLQLQTPLGICTVYQPSTACEPRSFKHMKTDRYNDDGIMMFNNFQHGPHLFAVMLYY